MAAPEWISPAAASAMLTNVPLEAAKDFGFAVLAPGSSEKRVLTADLVRAKLQPREPTAAELTTNGPLWPITAATSRLTVAPGVGGDPNALEAIFEDYDAKVRSHQKMLAVVLTMHFDHDWPVTDILPLVGAYALDRLALARRLTSLTVVHRPGDELSSRRPHAHCVVLARSHRASGWGEIQSDIAAKDAAGRFHADWAAFRDQAAPRFR